MDYTTTITTDKTPQEVFNAINDVKGWWIGTIHGNADKVGSEFTYNYKEFHASKQKVTELVPGKKVVWHLEEADLSFAQNKEEWKGTDIVFEILVKDGKTVVTFTHRGLTPKFECYEACSGGWDFYITTSLQNFLVNGVGVDPGF